VGGRAQLESGLPEAKIRKSKPAGGGYNRSFAGVFKAKPCQSGDRTRVNDASAGGWQNYLTPTSGVGGLETRSRAR